MEEAVLNALKDAGYTPDTKTDSGAAASQEGEGAGNSGADDAGNAAAAQASAGDNGDLGEQAQQDNNAAAAQAQEEPAAAATQAATGEPDLTEEKILAFLKDKGIAVSSIEDLKVTKEPTEEEKKEQEKRIQNEAIVFGLQNKKISQDQLNSLAVDQSLSDEGVAKIVFSQKLKALEPNISQEEIDARFNEWSMNGEDENNWIRKLRQQEMSDMRSAYINEKYKNVLGITDEYKSVMTEKVKQEQYNSKVANAINSMPEKMEFEIPITTADGKTEKKTYTYQIPKDTREQVKSEFLKPETYQLLGKEQVDDQNLQMAMQNRVKEKDLGRIIATIANSHASEILSGAKLGRKGIVPERDAHADMEDQTLANLDPIVAATVKELRGQK